MIGVILFGLTWICFELLLQTEWGGTDVDTLSEGEPLSRTWLLPEPGEGL